MIAVVFAVFAGWSCGAEPAPSNMAQQLRASAQQLLRQKLSELRAAEGAQASAAHAEEAQEFYSYYAYGLPWVQNGKPSVQARQIIQELKSADKKGLLAQDYDGPLWDVRLAGLESRQTATEDALVAFDAELTLATMRYVSDLHVGRVPPETMHFAFSTKDKSLDLSEFLQQKLVGAQDVPSAIGEVEPQFLTYRRTLGALNTYRELAPQTGEALPVPLQVVRVGDSYARVGALAKMLRLFGDLSAGDGSQGTIYNATLAEGVNHFQMRHGLAPTGVLDVGTVQELNTPVGQRIRQLELTLERWRWLPQNYSRPPIVVNIPEFRLYAANKEHRVAFSTNIIVGRSYRYKTPVFAGELRAVIFRPYWNVPAPIAMEEIVPQAEENPTYMDENFYELVGQGGKVLAETQITKRLAERLRTGQIRLRQKPGSLNSLGLIKFELPNSYDVYLHSTPARELFSRSRRDFSHGCIRLEDPVGLAEWVLRGNTGWDKERILAAMNGDQTTSVTVQNPIPIWIVYGTAVVHEDGQVYFLNDIYGYDAALERALELRGQKLVTPSK